MRRQIHEDYKGESSARTPFFWVTPMEKRSGVLGCWRYRWRVKRRASLCWLSRELGKGFGSYRARWEKTRFLAEIPLVKD